MSVMIIDANNMAHRARHAYHLSHAGRDTSITYGVLRMIMSLVKGYRPDSVVACFDAGRPLYRQTLVPQYKEHRNHDNDETYGEFVGQLIELQHILPYFGVLCAQRYGIEADDLLYQASRMLYRSTIVTGDDDLMQAINENTDLLKPTKKGYQPVNLGNFRDVAGVPPEWFLVAKALRGDSSDNIPGVIGVGPATVEKIFEQGFMDLSAIKNLTLRWKVEDYLKTGLYPAAMACMDLTHDLCGARNALVSAVWIPFTSKIVYKYCMTNAFSSLIEAGSLGQTFGPLKKPKFDTSDCRLPRIWDANRHPEV